jgi:hypothetical protein
MLLAQRLDEFVDLPSCCVPAASLRIRRRRRALVHLTAVRVRGTPPVQIHPGPD